ncbi:hypothetical protein DRQ29_02850 [bacterium]|nr:DUF5320 domain-containing protein [Syntrophobacterales bacterium]RKZ27845.1 MAG: hypothetical protein DRQ29_02850 [bacterium]
MPGGDRTGPAGMGPMTGRAAGYCGGYQAPGFANPIGGFGRGAGFGRGGGWGYRNQFYATGLTGWQRGAYGYPYYGRVTPYGTPYGPAATKQQELDALKGQAEYLEDSLEGINKRIAELEKENKEK